MVIVPSHTGLTTSATYSSVTICFNHYRLLIHVFNQMNNIIQITYAITRTDDAW